ncbi:MAG: hypothetical protein GY841_04345 [FCB group bacterium]|nr:hypothetical protein [FCB group bacterium]
MKPIKTATFRGVKYKIDFDAESAGSCDPPNRPPDRELCVSEPIGNNQKTLYYMTHEALHALFWQRDEDDIVEAAQDLSRFLWRAGWRLK